MTNQQSPFKQYKLDYSMSRKNKIMKKIALSPENYYYTFLNYDKCYITFDNYEFAMYRSVIFSCPEKKPISFSPPRSIPFDRFIEKYSYSKENIWANEFIEGLMVHLFYDPRASKWYIASKNHLLAPAKPAHRMFLQAFTGENQTIHTRKDVKRDEFTEVNELPFLEYFPKWASYTFVLQHPNIPSLFSITRPQAYMIAMYRIDENIVEYLPHEIMETMDFLKNLEGMIAFPKRIRLTSFSQYPQWANTRTGIMLWNDETGERAKWTNPIYESIQRMLRIDSSLQYFYFCLRRIRFIMNGEQKTNIPSIFHLLEKENSKIVCKNQLIQIDKEFNAFINDVFNAYLETYIFQNKKAMILKKHANYASQIHKQVYLPRMKLDKNMNSARRFHITRSEIANYFDQMEPREIFYLFCEDRRVLSSMIL
jgi:hypothetical protein